MHSERAILGKGRCSGGEERKGMREKKRGGWGEGSDEEGEGEGWGRSRVREWLRGVKKKDEN